MKKIIKIFYLIIFVSAVCVIGIWKKNPFNLGEKKETFRQIPHKLLNVREIKIDDKIPLWFVKTKGLNIVSVKFLFKGAGLIAVPLSQSGLNELIEEIAIEGAGSYSAKAFKEFLLEKNIQLDVSSSLDNFSITVRTTAHNVADAFEVIKLVSTQLKVNDDSLKQVKERMLISLNQSLSSPKAIVQDQMNKLLFGDQHPYAQTIHDKLKSIPSITKKKILDFQNQFFTKDSLKIAVCGNISEQDLVRYVRSTIKDFPSHPPSHSKEIALRGLSSSHALYMDVPQSCIAFAQSGLPRKHPDFYAWFLAWRIIGDDNFNGRLFNEIRKNKGLAYSIGASVFSNIAACGVKGVTATKSDNVKAVIQLIKQECERIQQNGITQAELDFAKGQVIGEYTLSFDSTVRIVQKLTNFMADDLPVSYVNDRNKHFGKLTLEDVNRVIKKYVRPNELLFVVVGRHGKK